MQTGMVKKWDNNAGWGFIEGDDGKNYFFNISNIRQGQMIRVGINVKFDSFESQRGPEAENITLF